MEGEEDGLYVGCPPGERGGEKSLVKIWEKGGPGSFSQVSTKALRWEGAGKANALGPNEGQDG